MNDMIRFGGILLIVSAIAAAGLAAVYQVTKPRIDLQKELELQNALSVALPGADLQTLKPITDQGNILYYNGFTPTDSSRLVGHAFIASGWGYSSTIVSMIGVDTSGKIIGVKILSQGETPGLGTKVQEIKRGDEWPWFQQQFLGRAVSGLAVDKDGGEIKSITGATISSRAVIKSIVVGYNNLFNKQE